MEDRESRIGVSVQMWASWAHSSSRLDSPRNAGHKVPQNGSEGEVSDVQVSQATETLRSFFHDLASWI